MHFVYGAVTLSSYSTNNWYESTYVTYYVWCIKTVVF